MTSRCLHGLSPFLLSFSSTACNLEMQCSTPMHVDELPEATTTLMLMHKKERYCKILAKRFLHDCQRCLFIYDLWSCPNCSKLMPKSEETSLPIPCNAGLSSQSHSSHFQTKTGHFLFICLRQIVDVCIFI